MSAKTSNTKPVHVNFKTNGSETTDRKKFLTAKYGTHQMNLIKKRLKVELWMHDQLQALFQVDEDFFDEVDIDLDELLDLDQRQSRIEWLRKKLTHAKQPQAAVDTFIVELLEQANTL
ncbi:PREDICTED: uncharacterized protein LOC108377065 [Rhagoletis zephyria]|uniref:uncharacterized protein LOC108377065 n=1 Tax=Rhagoletis zephyria TaxID=28612 RepID=UPI0008114F6B|nr:PREDICTED: uncharacterized protein LOC108377065 [Rhagoletis zephyria]KAH9406613.1 hypothetical protein TYRP_013595 [Tyrophagus putrescentiae]